MKVIPKGAWIVIKPDEVSKAGALYVPDSAKQQYRKGAVVAVPEVPSDEAKGISVGQTVLYDTIGSVEIRLGSSEFVMLKAREILGFVLEDIQ